MHADDLTDTEVILRIVDVCLAHLGDRQVSSQLSVELHDRAMLQDVDDRPQCL